MRTILLTAAAALLLSATAASAQTGTTTPVQTKPMATTPKPVPSTSLADQKKTMNVELGKTKATADNLLATANSMAKGSEGDRLNTIMRVADAAKIVSSDLAGQVALVDKATDKTIGSVLNKAKEVNAASARKLTSLKAELPKAETSTTTPVETKPTAK